MSRIELRVALQRAGFSRLAVEYNCSADWSQLMAVTCHTAGGEEVVMDVQAGNELTDKIEAVVYECLDLVTDGWVDCQATFGRVEIDVDRDVMVFHNSTRQTLVTDNQFQLPLVGAGDGRPCTITP